MENQKENALMFLGIDVSKAKLDVALLREPHARKIKHKVFKNNEEGHLQLLDWLQTRERREDLATNPIIVHACLEATGTFAEDVAVALAQAGHIVSIVNPAQIHAFGASELKRTKTDKADAQLIAHFCAQKRPPAWTPPALELRELQAMVRRLEALAEMKRMEENRLSSGVHGQAVRASLLDHIRYLDNQIGAAQADLKKHIETYPELGKSAQLLQSIPGIGFTTAVAILAEIGHYSLFRKASQIVAFARLAPRIRQSGSSVRGKERLSKIGSSRLRKALYFPAITALKHNPILQDLKERLKDREKAGKLVVGAAMRKLLQIAYGVLKSGVPFDPNFGINFKAETSPA